VAAAVVTVGQAAVAAPPGAVPRALVAATEPVLTAVSVSPGAVAVRGLDLVQVTVSATFSDTAWGDPEMVVLHRTTKGAWDRSAPGELLAILRRSSGSGSAGTFTGTVQVPSSAHGSWRVALIGWPGPFGPAIDVTTSGLPPATLAVTGTHRPRMRFSVVPQPVPYPQTRAVARAAMSFDDTRAPISGLTVGFGTDNSCAERIGPDATVRTDSHGVAARRITVSGPWVTCAWVPFPGSSRELSNPGWAVGAGLPRLGTVTSAAPSRASARRRTAVPVTGHVAALVVPARNPVQLQRLVGRTWRTVNTALVRSSARFTVTANPPRGRNYYRMTFPGTTEYGPSTSSTFTITGT
jgi:hypothetical protein